MKSSDEKIQSEFIKDEENIKTYLNKRIQTV